VERPGDVNYWPSGKLSKKQRLVRIHCRPKGATVGLLHYFGTSDIWSKASFQGTAATLHGALHWPGPLASKIRLCGHNSFDPLKRSQYRLTVRVLLDYRTVPLNRSYFRKSWTIWRFDRRPNDDWCGSLFFFCCQLFRLHVCRSFYRLTWHWLLNYKTYQSINQSILFAKYDITVSLYIFVYFMERYSARGNGPAKY